MTAVTLLSYCWECSNPTKDQVNHTSPLHAFHLLWSGTHRINFFHLRSSLASWHMQTFNLYTKSCEIKSYVFSRVCIFFKTNNKTPKKTPPALWGTEVSEDTNHCLSPLNLSCLSIWDVKYSDEGFTNYWQQQHNQQEPESSKCSLSKATHRLKGALKEITWSAEGSETLPD